MSQARLPRAEPSTELITAHKVNNCDAHAACPDPGFFGSPEAPCCLLAYILPYSRLRAVGGREFVWGRSPENKGRGPETKIASLFSAREVRHDFGTPLPPQDFFPQVTEVKEEFLSHLKGIRRGVIPYCGNTYIFKRALGTAPSKR